MGNFARPLSEGVSLIASDETWIEDKAIQQLQIMATLPGMVQAVGMPDLHPGRGIPVGAAFFSVGRFYPALVGNDIGCGMALWRTDLPIAKTRLDKLEKRLGSLDFAIDDKDWINDLVETEDASSQTGFEHALGTIGGGNHFAELQTIDAVFDEEAAAFLGLNKKCFMLLVHSGSRGLGEKILREHVAQFGDSGLVENTPKADEYLKQHNEALRFAVLNRYLIGARFLERIGAKGKRISDIAHNLVSPAGINGRNGWLHRKGAAPSDLGISVIPGSRGDYSYLVKPIPLANSLFSLAHGAGRKWMRSDCKGRLSSRYTLAQLGKTRLGSRVICDDRRLIYEEAPEAYKSVDTVIDALSKAGLITLVARLKPVLTYKTRSEDRS